jgi:integrase
LKPFKSVDLARVRYLTIAEAKRLLNAADVDFRPLLQAALESGCRYGELARLQVMDFSPDSGTLSIRKSKTDRPRHVVLTEQGADFFRNHCSGLSGTVPMFRKADGSPWKKSDQLRPMRVASDAARLDPPASFHTCRHTWASLSVMAGMPLMVVARNLGHVDTRMVEAHYGHLAPSFIADQVRAAAPKFGFKSDKKVLSLR